MRNGVRRGVLLGVCLLPLLATPALAHKLNVFASVDKTSIRGEAYFRGGVPARGATVHVSDPVGQKLAEVTTDEEGKFVVDAQYRCEHRIVVDAGSGHGGEFVVRADELPESLPVRSPGGSPSSVAETEPANVSPGPSPAKLVEGGSDQLASEVESMGKQLVELRRQLAAHEDRVRFQDVLGGIGYIVGVMGAAFYFLGIRRKEQNRSS